MLSKFEIRKDMVQELTESAATHVGRIATILTGAVGQVTHEVGEWMSDAFEMREAARRAHAENAAELADTAPDEDDALEVPDPDVALAPEPAVATPDDADAGAGGTPPVPDTAAEGHPTPAAAAAVTPTVPPPSEDPHHQA